MSTPTTTPAVPLPEDLTAVLKRMRMPYLRAAAPEVLATAAVDRLLHHAHVIITEGTSLRLAEATAGKGVVPLH